VLDRDTHAKQAGGLAVATRADGGRAAGADDALILGETATGKEGLAMPGCHAPPLQGVTR
jgi:hypothetical protein